jgi:hypothetical protein
MKFLLASMRSLTNCEIPSSNPLQRACSGFLTAACAFKSCSETPVILKIVPKAGYECTLEESTNESKGKPVQKFDAAFGTTFKISKCFQRSKQKLHTGY